MKTFEIFTVADENGYTPILFAASEGRHECLKVLLDRGGNPNAKGNCNITPLHLAATSAHAECIEELLKHGADVNAKMSENFEGCTPLDVLEKGAINVADKRRAMCKVLLENSGALHGDESESDEQNVTRL